MAKENVQTQEVQQLPVVPLRGLLAFPSTVLSFDVGRNRSVNAVELAAGGDKLLFVVAQRDSAVEKPEMKDLYSVGTVIKIRQVMRLPDGAVRVMAEGRSRGLLLQIDERGDHQNIWGTDLFWTGNCMAVRTERLVDRIRDRLTQDPDPEELVKPFYERALLPGETPGTGSAGAGGQTLYRLSSFDLQAEGDGTYGIF